MKKLILILPAAFLCALMVMSIGNVCFSSPCTVNASVCDYVIDSKHICVNGVGTNSIMPFEDGNRNYVETNSSCGCVWYRKGIISYPTGDLCGTSVSPDCE